MITFEDYAKRRNMTLDNFTHLDYEEYISWCALRKLIPVDRAKFRSKTETLAAKEVDTTEEPTLQPTLELEPVSVAVQINPINWNTIHKQRKTALLSMCKLRGIEHSDKTKKELIKLLKQFEGIE